MKANKHDKHDNGFNVGFHNLMASAMADDWYKKHGKALPRKWKKRLDEARDWLSGLSAKDYDSLIH